MTVDALHARALQACTNERIEFLRPLVNQIVQDCLNRADAGWFDLDQYYECPVTGMRWQERDIQVLCLLVLDQLNGVQIKHCICHGDLRVKVSWRVSEPENI